MIFLIKVKAPGKLYIAGEYAVVETGYPAILVAINQFVHVTINKSDSIGSIVSKQYEENSIFWTREGNHMIFDNRDNPFHYILAGIKITEEYAQICNCKLDCYHLSVDSQLDSNDGKKYGLGSSAAVTVATVKGLCAYYNLPITKEYLFKLAAIAHFEVQGNGSLGDIAASVYGGWLAYHSVNREWLMLARQKYSLSTLLKMTWPDLNIKELTPPASLNLLIGWTGSPASTSQLVDAVSLTKAEKQQKYTAFLAESKSCLNNMINGFATKSLSTIQRELKTNRRLLHDLGKISGLNIETPLLKELITSAKSFGGAAKTSGAGGGDCGIVILNKNVDTSLLLAKWKELGIIPLNLKVHIIK